MNVMASRAAAAARPAAAGDKNSLFNGAYWRDAIRLGNGARRGIGLTRRQNNSGGSNCDAA
jgi:hypothetical protein